MPCFHPIAAYRSVASGEVSFSDRGDCRPFELPCGQCVGCRLERSRQWAMRCMHEASLHDVNSFVTLTYKDEFFEPSLNYKDFQLFMKRLRKDYRSPVRFYMCGEYGEKFLRPHFHALLFGVHFSDRKMWRQSAAGFDLYRSDRLERLWPFGNAEIGDVTFESAAYVARYVMKKITGDAATEHYARVNSLTGEIVNCVPEFNRMSLKPGIGLDWIRLYRSDVYKQNGEAYVVVNGMKSRPPRYYDEYVKGTGQFDDVLHQRYKRGLLTKEDNTTERLEVRERVSRARLSFKSRSVE